MVEESEDHRRAAACRVKNDKITHLSIEVFDTAPSRSVFVLLYVALVTYPPHRGTKVTAQTSTL